VSETSIGSAALRAALADAEPGAVSRSGAIRIVRAPGRVNLIGEHTDYNEGFVLPAAIDLEVRIAFAPADDRLVRVTRLDTGERRQWDLDGGREPDGTWLDYVAGTAWALDAAGRSMRGIRAVIASSLPMNAGLSSSAALELGSARALLDEGVEAVDPLELARICQRAENEYVGVRCGLMDQFASACGHAGSALLLDCRSLDWRPVSLPLGAAVLVVVDSGSPRRLGASEYNARRAQCEAAVALLARDDPAVRSLRDVTRERLAALQGRLDPLTRRRCEHVVTENERVLDTVAALEAGDLAAVGEAFAASHASLRDLYEVSSPELDALVAIANDVPGVIGARLTGAGFGGCTVNLVRPDAVERLERAVMTDYPTRSGLQPRVLTVRPVDGAGFLPD
jgi:galactokinase